MPKEARRIACDRNGEKECAALAAHAPTKVFDGRQKVFAMTGDDREICVCN
jgi:hypothetical protein